MTKCLPQWINGHYYLGCGAEPFEGKQDATMIMIHKPDCQVHNQWKKKNGFIKNERNSGNSKE